MPYLPPRVKSLGPVFEPIQRRGEEFAVRLARGYFELPPDQRERLLGDLLEKARGGNGACRELALYDARDGRRVGRFSREFGLQLV